MRTFDASRATTFRHVELPSALPGVFTGAKIAVVVAVIGAVFAEWAGASSGLGYLFEQSIPQFLTARAYAAVVILSLFAIALFALLTLAERLVLPWAYRPREERPMIKRALALIAGLALLPGLAACGEKKESVSSSGPKQSLTLMLDWFPNADHVGLYQALADGSFERAGLNVHVQVPSDPALPLKLLQAGKTDLAISYEPEVLLARNQGVPLVSVGGDRAATADVDRVHRLKAHPHGRRSARQDRRRRRNPLPARLPDDGARARRTCR